MSYEMLVQEMKSLPEECLDDVADYMGYVIYRRSKKTAKATHSMARHFGSVKISRDGLDIQKEMRDEWD